MVKGRLSEEAGITFPPKFIFNQTVFTEKQCAFIIFTEKPPTKEKQNVMPLGFILHFNLKDLKGST